jgi:hypothetical protein
MMPNRQVRALLEDVLLLMDSEANTLVCVLASDEAKSGSPRDPYG